MLLRAAGVVERDVGDLPVPAQEVRRLAVDVEDGKLLVPFEHVQPPLDARLSRLRGLRILHRDAVDDVRVLEEFARRLHVHTAVILFVAGGRGRRALLSDFPRPRPLLVRRALPLSVGPLFPAAHHSRRHGRPRRRRRPPLVLVVWPRPRRRRVLLVVLRRRSVSAPPLPEVPQV